MPATIHPGFNGNACVVVWVHNPSNMKLYALKQTYVIQSLRQRIITANVCTSPRLSNFLMLKELELLQKDISNLMRSPVLIVGDMNIDLLKQNTSFGLFSNLMKCNGMTQLLATAIRITIVSKTLIDHFFHIHFVDILDCDLLDTGLTDHGVIFLELPFSCTKNDDTETNSKFFLRFILKAQDNFV